MAALTRKERLELVDDIITLLDLQSISDCKRILETVLAYFRIKEEGKDGKI